MRNKLVAAIAALVFLFALGTQRASAVPIFAQRYHFRCTQCHSVLPELNAYGNYFRSHGYRLPLPRHGTTIFAIRYQMAYAVDPAAGTRRWSRVRKFERIKSTERCDSRRVEPTRPRPSNSCANCR